MAAGYLPEPGTQYGPCADECAHTDCARTRQQAGMTCPTCGQQIGYERGFYQRDNWQVLVHAACAEDEDF